MAALTPDQKLFIVMRNACFDTPALVAQAWKEEFPGQPVPSKQQIQLYDPTCRAGAKLSKELRKVFEATRTKLLKGKMDIPVASKNYRLMLLQKLATDALVKRNSGQLMSVLEQAAKESGEAYTNKHRVAHSGAISTPAQQVSDDELVRKLAKFGIAASLPGTGMVASGVPAAGEDGEGGGSGPLH